MAKKFNGSFEQLDERKVRKRASLQSNFEQKIIQHLFMVVKIGCTVDGGDHFYFL